MSKVRNYSLERKKMQKDGVCPDWMTTMGWQLFSEKYLNGDSKNPKDQYERIAKTLAEYAPKEYPDFWNTSEYMKCRTSEDALFSVISYGYI